MDSINSSSTCFCVICYRINSSVVIAQTNENFKLFVKVLSRFVNNDKENSKHYCLKAITDLQCSSFGCCKDCLNQVEEFSNVYHQYKCLELQLEWKIDKLVNIIKLANKVPSRVLEIKNVLQDNNDGDNENQDKSSRLQLVQNFRKHLTKICRRKLKRSQPRIILQRDQQRVQKHRNISVSIETFCHDKDGVKPVTTLLNSTNLSIPENEDYPENLVDESINQTSPQNTNATSNDHTIISTDTQTNHNCNDNTETTLDGNPATFSDEEIFEDFNTFPTCDDPLGDIDNHNDDTDTQTGLPTIGETTNIHDTITKSQYLPPPTVSANISDVHSETYKLSSSFNTDELITCQTSLTTLHDQSIETKHSVVNTQNEASTNQRSSPTKNPNPEESISHQNDLEQNKHPNITQPSNKTSQPSRYNLRQNRVTKFVAHSENDDSESEKESGHHQAHSSRSSSVSSSSHDDEEIQEKIALPNFNFERKPNPGGLLLGFYPCLVVGCEEAYANENLYKIHLKLHKPGSYTCIFCKHVETDVIKLANHEYKFHSKTQSDPSEPQDRRSNPWKCPRCSYQSTCNLDYDTHFAYAHFKIGVNPESPSLSFQIRKYRRFKPKNPRLQIVECETCKKKIRAYKMKLHFRKFHDLTKIDPKDVQRCDDDNCSAYFLKREQLLRHFNSEHNIERLQLKKFKRKVKKVKTNQDCSLQQSKRNISKRKFISCEICTMKIPEEQKEKHYKTYHDTTNSKDIKKCTKENCQAYFLTDEQLKRHLTSQHEKLFNCGRCKRFFPTYILLYRHYRESHKRIKSKKTMKTPEGKPIKFHCMFCEYSTKFAKTIALHEATKHATPTDQDAALRNQYPWSRCPRCPYEYRYKTGYLGHFINDHLNILSENCPDACKICSSGKIYVENRKNHFDNFHNTDLLIDPTEVFKCDFTNCSAYFVKSIQLYCHKNKVHPILKCFKCVKTFETRRNLLNHLRNCQKLHTGESHPNLGVKCDYPTCTNQFHSKEEMEIHKLYAHRKNPKIPKEKNEICPKCEKRFISVGMLRRHINMIHSERSIVCSDCGKVLKSQMHLDTHMLFHKGPDCWKYQCSECGKKCFDKQKLEEHLRTHTKEKPFVCQFCGGKYAHRHNWRNHLKTKHAGEKGIEEIVGRGRQGNYLSRKGSKKGECFTASWRSV